MGCCNWSYWIYYYDFNIRVSETKKYKNMRDDEFKKIKDELCEIKTFIYILLGIAGVIVGMAGAILGIVSHK